MKRRILVSLIAFSVFSLIGPLIRLIFPPVPLAGRFDSIVNDVVLYIWPTTVLGIGQGIGWQTHVALVAYNLLFFAVVGLLIGLVVSRAWVAVMLYFVTCVLLILIEGWAFRSSFGFLSWCALVIAFLLYAIPFGTVRHVLKSGAGGAEIAR